MHVLAVLVSVGWMAVLWLRSEEADKTALKEKEEKDAEMKARAG